MALMIEPQLGGPLVICDGQLAAKKNTLLVTDLIDLNVDMIVFSLQR